MLSSSIRRIILAIDEMTALFAMWPIVSINPTIIINNIILPSFDDAFSLALCTWCCEVAWLIHGARLRVEIINRHALKKAAQNGS